MNIAGSVQERYSKAAQEFEPGLCCPVDYDPQYLAVIPREVLDRDYGCGDPVSFVKEGEVVLDLGSGGGKVCFIASQIVGPTGRVIGVDMNDDMLSLARGAQVTVAEQLGYDNVLFLKGQIEDLQLDQDAVDELLKARRITSYDDLQQLEAELARMRQALPLIPTGSVDVVISNCVLNLVAPGAKQRLFRELHRVLKRGGRAVISDIVSDEDVPLKLQQDSELWSGCYSGALREDAFLDAFTAAGLYGTTVLRRDAEPWHVVKGIEFRSVTTVSYKGKEGACWDHKQAVIYRGPFKQVQDDDGHLFERGARAAVCQKTYDILTRDPYTNWFDPVAPSLPVSPEQAQPFPCDRPFFVREPSETKGSTAGQAGVESCSDSSCC